MYLACNIGSILAIGTKTTNLNLLTLLLIKNFHRLKGHSTCLP